MSTSESKQRDDTEGTRSRILSVASDLFAQKGYEATRMNVVADAVGVNKATVYYHFDSKEELYGEVLKRPLEEIAENFKTSSGSASAAERLRTNVTFVIDQLRSHPNLSKMLLREIINDGDLLPDSVRLAVEEVWDKLGELLEASQTNDSTDGIPDDIVRRTLVGALLTSVLETDFFPEDRDPSEGTPSPEAMGEFLLAWLED